MNRRSLFSRMAAAAAGVVLASSVEVMGFCAEAPTILKNPLSKAVNSDCLCISNMPIYVREQSLKMVEKHCMEILTADLPEGYTLREVKGKWKNLSDTDCSVDDDMRYFSAWAIADQI